MSDTTDTSADRDAADDLDDDVVREHPPHEEPLQEVLTIRQ